MRKSGFMSALLALALAACGGGSDDAFQPGTGPGTVGPVVAAIQVISSSPTIPSDGTSPAQITALVKDANNQFLSGVNVIFSANNNGSLLITQRTTSDDGVATADLSSLGDPSRRTITVTAQAGTMSSTVNVDVAGTVLSVQGPTALSLNQQGTFTVSLVDAGNRGVASQSLTITSARNNTLSASTVTTNTSGQATFTMTASNGGNDTVTVAGLGLTAAQQVSVNADSFAFTTPAANTEVGLGAAQAISLTWLANGSPVVGQTVNFSTTRGTVTPSSAVTNAAGVVSATVSATNAGAAIISATGTATSAQLPIEFIALLPTAIDVQASPSSIGTTQSSTVTAIVRDVSGNLVKNRIVQFTLTDVTGGTLSVGSAATDSQGRAQTVYTASNTISANEGVLISATVQGVTPTLSDQVALTVARREVFISLGTGNEISEPNTAQYQKEYIVQVTDSNGNGVASVPVSMRILSDVYHKGYRVDGSTLTPAVTGWLTFYTVPGSYFPSVGCADEDVNRNGVLDAGEDFNASGRIEAGNIAAVSPSNVVTDASGFALVSVSYPQDHAFYLEVTLSASATVQGTEYVRSSRFMLGGSAADFNNTNNGAPGGVSPFGQAATCNDPN